MIFCQLLSAKNMEDCIIDNLNIKDIYSESTFVSENGKYIITAIFLKDSLIHIEYIESLKNYFKKKETIEYYDIKEKFISDSSYAFGQGILPNIELPIKFSPKVARYIGQGGEISINGSEKIEFGMSKSEDIGNNAPDNVSTPIPEFLSKQHMDINVVGTVGQKIFINMHQNSDEDISSIANNINLEYKGDEDDIIRNIRAGDVDMSIPNTRLIGALPSHKGLFGLNLSGGVGLVDFTLVASKEKSESERKNFIGKSILNTDTLWDISFAKNKYYLLDTIFYISPTDTIISLNVFLDDGNGSNDSISGAKIGIGYPDPNNPGIDTGFIEQGMFNLLEEGEGKDYMYDLRNNILTLKNSLINGQRLAVSYIYKSSGVIDTVGSVNYSNVDTLSLKLISSAYPISNSPIWNLMLKNIYQIGIGQIMQNSFEVHIYKVEPNGEPKDNLNGHTFLNLLGLANTDTSNVNYDYIDFIHGFIIFPQLYPFLSDNLTVKDSIYDKVNFINSDGRKYFIVVTYRGLQQEYDLNSMNILEGSELITIDGVTLQKGTDYTIDYEYGTVKFMKRIDNPDADIKIDYQISPLFSASSKSLIGFNAQMLDIPGLNFSTSWLYKSEKRGNQYPTLDEISREDFVGEMDISYNHKLGFINNIFNRISYFTSSKPSGFQISANAAFSNPKLNVYKNAYIDDMEGVNLETSLLGGSYIYWHYSGVPVNKDTSDYCDQIFWFNPHNGIKVRDIYPNYPLEQLENRLSVLKIVMNPHNGSPNSWGGITNVKYVAGEDYSHKDYIELWVKGNNGTLHIDYGTNMREDAPRKNSNGDIVGFNNIMDTEDQNRNGILDENLNEDTGLDEIMGVDGTHKTGDDDNDDYRYYSDNPDNYLHLNGTEENKRLDSEDLDSDGSLNIRDDYYTVSLDLATSVPVISRSNGWKLFRIPIKKTENVDTVGNPSVEHIKYVRLWIDGLSSKDSISLVNFNITGNKWRIGYVEDLNDSIISQSDSGVLSLSIINNQEYTSYIPPYNVKKTQYGSYEKEQSLVIQYNNLESDNQIFITETFSRNYNYMDYKTLGIYIYNNNSNLIPFTILRFYSDDNNFYEYTASVDTGWNFIKIPISQFTDIKRIKPDSINDYTISFFRIKGNPSFRNIKKIGIGLRNKTGSILSGEFYIDDILLTDINSVPGYSLMASSQFNISDIFTFNASINNGMADFRPLNSNALGSDKIGVTYNALLETGKFLPSRWGISIPLNYRYTLDRLYPKYQIYSDIILLDPILRNIQKTISKIQFLSASYSKSSKFSNPVLHLIDPARLTFSYNKTRNRGYLMIDSSDIITSSFSYNYLLNIKKLKLFNKMLLSFAPENINLGANYNYNFNKRYSRADTGFIPSYNLMKKYLSYNMSSAYKPVQAITFSYNNMFTRDLNLFRDTSNIPGSLIYTSHKGTFGYTPNFFSSFLVPGINYTFSFADNHNPELITHTDSTDIRNISVDNNISANVDIAYSNILKLLTSFRDKSKDTTYIKGSPGWILVKIDEFSSKFRPLKFQYNRTNNQQAIRVRDIPGYRYIFGMNQLIPEYLKTSLTSLKYTHSDNYSASTGFSISSISLNMKGSYSHGEQGESGNYDNQSISNKFTFPDATLTINKIPVPENLKSSVTSTNASISYSKTICKSGTPKEPNKNYNESILLSPSLNFKLMNKISCSASYRYSLTTNIYKSISETGNDKSLKTMNGSFGYIFNLPRDLSIPLFGSRLKLVSNINTNLSFNYMYDKTLPFAIEQMIDTTPGGVIDTFDLKKYQTASIISSYSITGSVGFSFSRDITGGLDGNYSITDYKNTGMKIRKYGFQFWVKFNF